MGSDTTPPLTASGGTKCQSEVADDREVPTVRTARREIDLNSFSKCDFTNLACGVVSKTGSVFKFGK